jgi:SAM-dependent methyltransferase
MRVGSFYNALSTLASHLPKSGSKVLDVGTAGGAFLVAGNKFGYNTIGLEPCGYLVDAGKKRGFQIEEGVLKTAPFPKNSFDMICFWDVLEHVTDPVAELKYASNLLKSDGVLLINYPDIGTWMAKLAGSKFWWLLSVHLVHFDKNSLTKACDAAGFEPFLWKRYWQQLEFGYLLQMFRIYFPFLGSIFERFTPQFLKKIKVYYYASQTTCLARKKK